MSLYTQVEDDTGRHMTYNEFVLNVKRLGAALLKQDLKPGQVVTICAPNCMEHVVLYHALARIGCTYHGINAAFPDGSPHMCINIYYDLLILYNLHKPNFKEINDNQKL